MTESLKQVYCKAGRFDRAIELDREIVDESRRREGPESLDYAACLASLGRDLLKVGQWSEAETVAQSSLAIREHRIADHWVKFASKAVLGEARLGQKRYAEAAALLTDGYEGMKQRIAQIPPLGMVRLAEALDALTRLAEETGKPDEARAWREEKARIMAPPAPATPEPAKPATSETGLSGAAKP